MRRFFISVALLLAAGALVVALLLVFARQPEPFPAGSESAQRLLPGPHGVTSYDVRFVDASRSSPAHRDYPGASERVLEATVWHPAGSLAPQPLVVYSHGFTSTRRGGAYLGEHLASYGYVVIAADFPMTNMRAPGGPWVRDIVNQPGDVSYLIDQVLAAASEPGHVLYQRVDPARIGVMGISLGGMTSTLVSYHPVWGDARIAATLSIAGPTVQLSERFFESRPSLPFLMLAADIDALVPYRSNALPVLEKIPGAELVTVVNGSHTGFAGPAASLRFMDNPDALGCWAVQRNVEPESPEDFWLDQLGTPEQGINYDAPNELCQIDPLPAAMNPLRQQMITTVVVAAFFQAVFSDDPDEADRAREFLSGTLARELEEVTYARAAD